MKGSRSPQQEVGPMFLLPLLLLLLLVISVVGNTCGCWSTNQVYVHYKPPVSGWFSLSHKRKFLFERVYSVYTAQRQMHNFQLRYMAKRGYWLLLVKKDGRPRFLSTNKPNSTEQMTVSCPTGQCSCQVIQVNRSSCWSMNGLYYKYSNSTQPRRKSNHTGPQESKERRSQCLLAQLAQCLNNTKKGRNIENGCRQYMEPLLSNTTKLPRKNEHYTNHNYTLAKADKHDFWLIESEKRVYAVSRSTGPCPDQLTPDSSTWTSQSSSIASFVPCQPEVCETGVCIPRRPTAQEHTRKCMKH
ncbi:hypothetical protein GWK47_033897 [Chionoecetes opilio]|uniref:Uncharacterized protein n=1 Tax=Chionoecetes opilio TaxID=41210 RepID=A0A8J4YGK9_CHIOP|nr:hypothetical protein GWK47_033897 [Chionoecetes opilio]